MKHGVHRRQGNGKLVKRGVLAVGPGALVALGNVVGDEAGHGSGRPFFVVNLG
jgi:hypothetical protein